VADKLPRRSVVCTSIEVELGLGQIGGDGVTGEQDGSSGIATQRLFKEV